MKKRLLSLFLVVLLAIPASSMAWDNLYSWTNLLKLEEEGDIAFHFTCRNEPKLIGDGTVDLGDGLKLSFNNTLSLYIEKIENKCLPYDDLNFKYVWDRECLWRTVFKVRAKETVAKFEFA